MMAFLELAEVLDFFDFYVFASGSRELRAPKRRSIRRRQAGSL